MLAVGVRGLEAAGFGPTISDNLVESVHAEDRVNPAKFLAAFGIEQLGNTASKKLIAEFGTVAQLLSDVFDPDSLERLPGFGATKAEAIRSGLQRTLREIVSAMRYVQFATPLAATTAVGPFAGKRFVFTGALTDMDRPEAQKIVTMHGGEAQSGITMQTDYLVVGGGAKDEQRTKRDKAAKYAAKGSPIKVIDENEFVKMLATALNS
jgi:DNA ligase (NAD+)